jgi:hypothetical protein
MINLRPCIYVTKYIINIQNKSNTSTRFEQAHRSPNQLSFRQPLRHNWCRVGLIVSLHGCMHVCVCVCVCRRVCVLACMRACVYVRNMCVCVCVCVGVGVCMYELIPIILLYLLFEHPRVHARTCAQVIICHPTLLSCISQHTKFAIAACGNI